MPEGSNRSDVKSVVMIAHHFPPDASAGSYRPLRFVRHLPNYGWRPIVITENPQHYDIYDPGLLDQVPKEPEIIRVRNPDPWKAIQERRAGRFQQTIATKSTESALEVFAAHERPLRTFARKTVRRLESWFYRPDMAKLWIGAATKAVVNACRKSNAKVIWATGSPWSSFVVARKASRQTGIPYVMDLRDSWTLSYDELQALQSDRTKAKDRELLRSLFRDAQAVVLRYMAEAETYWRVYSDSLDEKRVHLIPNGYDGQIATTVVPRGDRCMVLYTGGVAPYIYESLLDALAQLKKSDPDIARLLRFVFVGFQTENIDRISARLNLADIVETSRPLPFAEISKLQKQAHALLLLGWKPMIGSEFGGSKIFGYLKSGRPIVGVLPQDENTRILRSVGVSTIADAGSVAQIIELLRVLVHKWSSDELSSLLPNRSACEMYSAERQAQALVQALEGKPALDPFIAGSAAPAKSLEKLIAEWTRKG